MPRVTEAQRRSLVTSFQEDVAVRPGNSGERERAPPKFQFDAPPTLRVSESDLKDVRSPSASPRFRADSAKHEAAARPSARYEPKLILAAIMNFR
jgi:hypothetical protein